MVKLPDKKRAGNQCICRELTQVSTHACCSWFKPERLERNTCVWSLHEFACFSLNWTTHDNCFLPVPRLSSVPQNTRWDMSDNFSTYTRNSIPWYTRHTFRRDRELLLRILETVYINKRFDKKQKSKPYHNGAHPAIMFSYITSSTHLRCQDSTAEPTCNTYGRGLPPLRSAVLGVRTFTFIHWKLCTLVLKTRF